MLPKKKGAIKNEFIQVENQIFVLKSPNKYAFVEFSLNL